MLLVSKVGPNLTLLCLLFTVRYKYFLNISSLAFRIVVFAAMVL